MNKLLAITLFIFSQQVHALDWYDMDIDQNFSLKNDIVFERENITIKKNTTFKLFEISDLPINVSLFQFEADTCLNPNDSTEMIIIDPRLKSSDPSVGVQLQNSCVLEILVETKHLFTQSLFLAKFNK